MDPELMVLSVGVPQRARRKRRRRKVLKERKNNG